MGSTPPGAYSTVIIKTSRPGISVRSFDMSEATLACCAITVPVDRNSRTNISFVFFMIDLSFAQDRYWPGDLGFRWATALLTNIQRTAAAFLNSGYDNSD